MYKLVVLSALLAVAAAHAVISGAPAVAYASAPLVQTWPSVRAIAAAPVATPVVSTYSAPAVAVGHAITKHVHYASQPVVTGYSSQILKPDLGALATPLATVTKQQVLAPARTVATITPQITQVQPEIHVRNVPVDVPVAQPVAVAAAAPVVHTQLAQVAPVVAAAPVVHTQLAQVAPVVAAAPVVHTQFAGVAPVVAAAPVVQARFAHAAPYAVAHNVLSTPYLGGHYAVPALSHNVW